MFIWQKRIQTYSDVLHDNTSQDASSLETLNNINVHYCRKRLFIQAS